MGTILDRIVETKRREVEAAKVARPLSDLLTAASARPPKRGFLRSLLKPRLRIIAEVKKASPSAGVIRADFNAVDIARIYEEFGADCLSVLTDVEYFQGHLSYLTQVKEATTIPVLRKDFLIDEYQIVEAAAAGADAVLLIAECLPGESLGRLYRYAVGLGLDVLMELHDADQLPRVLDTGCPLIGINNRDLRKFETRLEHTLDLLPKIPKGIAVVSESGIRTNEAWQLLEKVGVKAVLVGESLMRAPDIGMAFNELRGVSKEYY